MSGPKVVRIVTREEMVSRSEALLAQLDATVMQWAKEGSRIGELSESDIASTRKRASQIRDLLRDDRFVEIQRQVPQEISFLKNNLAELQNIAVERAARKLVYSRRMKENAALLLKSLSASTGLITSEETEGLRKLAAGDEVDGADGLLAAAFSRLSSGTASNSISDEQKQLAAALKETSESLKFQDWRDSSSRTAGIDEREARIARYVAELHLLEGQIAATPFLERLADASSEGNLHKRNLLLDSIVIDLAETAKVGRQARALKDEIRELVSSLTQIDSGELSAITSSLDLMTSSRDVAALSDLRDKARDLLVKEEQQIAAAARRSAVLAGLSALGYEVREGMATGWADSGRMVIRKSSTSGYGVELSGRADGGRLQVRAVALQSDHDKRRDRDIETLWCGDFQKLQASLASQGCALTIEQAREIGEVPLKIVDMGDTGRVDATSRSISKD